MIPSLSPLTNSATYSEQAAAGGVVGGGCWRVAGGGHRASHCQASPSYTGEGHHARPREVRREKQPVGRSGQRVAMPGRAARGEGALEGHVVEGALGGSPHQRGVPRRRGASRRGCSPRRGGAAGGSPRVGRSGRRVAKRGRAREKKHRINFWLV